MKKIDEYVEKNPFFTERIEDHNSYSYFFKEEQCNYEIKVLKRLDDSILCNKKHNYPIECFSPEVLWNAPVWFKKTVHIINELLFEKNRVWLLVNHKKRPVEDIFWSYCVIDEFGEELYELLRNNLTSNTIYDRNFLPLFMVIKSVLEKEKYTVNMFETDEGNIQYYVS